MMKEYILKEDVLNKAFDPIETYITDDVVCVEDIESIPVADVREVVHAKWENIEPYTAINGKYLKAQKCSNCYSLFVSNGNEPYSNHPYCCECGAKMDKDEVENAI